MPGGDRTGPMGQGPMTGRAAGYCTGSPTLGSMNPAPGRGFGNWGRGRGFWGGGGGREDVFEPMLDHIGAMPERLRVPVNAMRLGPFAAASRVVTATVDDRPVPYVSEVSGTARWAWVGLDVSGRPSTAVVRVQAVPAGHTP